MPLDQDQKEQTVIHSLECYANILKDSEKPEMHALACILFATVGAYQGGELGGLSGVVAEWARQIISANTNESEE